MAKTTSEIIAENKVKRQEANQIAESLDAIHQRQMAELGDESARKTQAVLDGTSDKLVKNKETTEIIGVNTIESFLSSPMLCGFSGIFLGVILASVFFMIKIKRMKKEYDVRLNEARTALDRMLKIAAKE